MTLINNFAILNRFVVAAVFSFAFSYSRAQVNYTGVLSYNPAGNGIIADVKVNISYEKTESGLEPKFSQQLVSIKGIKRNGTLFPLNQLPPAILQEYSKLPQVEVSYKLYKGSTFLKSMRSATAGASIMWKDLLTDLPNAAAIDAAECKRRGLELFFAGKISIRDVSVLAIPFNQTSFEKYISTKTPPPNAVKRASAVKTVPLSSVRPAPSRILKESPANLSRIFALIRKREEQLDDPTAFVSNIAAFVQPLEQQAEAGREIRGKIETEFRSRLAGKDGKKASGLAEIVAQLEKAAQDADLNSLQWLARAYTVANLYSEARRIYQFFMVNQDVHAGKMLAQNYQYEKKYYEAIQYYEKSAQQGDVESMKKLGAIYSGYLTLKICDLEYPQIDSTNYSIINLSSYPGVDFDKAVQWYEKAAAEDDTEAMILLGNLWSGEDERKYLAGERVPNNFVFKKDLGKARIWLQKAVDLGDKDALPLLTTISPGKIVKNNLPSAADLLAGAEELLQAKDYMQAFRKLKKSAELRNSTAMVKLAQLYSQGLGTEKNEEQAFSWLQKAARAGNPAAYYPLANLYQHGNGVTKSLTDAYAYYLQGVCKGMPEAMGQLGFMYYQGAGLDRNLKRALCYFIQAEDAGLRDAIFYIGNIFRFGGQGIHRDGNLAIAWYQKAITAENFGGYKFIGDTFSAEGSDIPDYPKAVENYKAFLDKEQDPEVLKAHRETVIKGIARLYSKGGFGLKQNTQLAQEWLNKLNE